MKLKSNKFDTADNYELLIRRDYFFFNKKTENLK